MRAAWGIGVVVALLGGCRDQCATRGAGAPEAEAADAERWAAAFVGQVDPALAMCVPTIRVGADADRVERRRVELANVDRGSVYRAMGEALGAQNPEVVEAWSRAAGPGDFAEAAATSAEVGALLGEGCPDDGPRTRAAVAARVAFVHTDTPGERRIDDASFGVYAASGRFVEVLRAPAPSRVVVDADTVALLGQDGTVIAADGGDGRVAFLGLSPTRALDTLEGLGRYDSDDGARRVYRSAGWLRRMGDGCLVDGELTFEWSDRAWSTWRDGDTQVVGYWAFDVSGRGPAVGGAGTAF